MSWTRPADLKAQLARLWERGELLRPAVTGDDGFPLRLTLKGPSSADLTDRFEAVRLWSTEMAAMPHLRIVWREVRHRVQGLQRLPGQVWVDGLNDAFALLGRRRDAGRFSGLVGLARARVPAVLPWLERRPLQALALADEWPRLLDLVGWLIAHPRPGIYPRQVDVPGVHSKFIETHRAVLSELLDLALPADAIQADCTGVTRFNQRYGFLSKPIRIRFRMLDERIPLVPGAHLPDITLDADSFAGLDLPVRWVFITENETNFLAFPNAAGALVIFGAGYGWESLARARWLHHCTIHYWGDIDTHGFGILDQLRGHFEQVTSFLMDRATLQAHATVWGFEDQPLRIGLSRLTPEERALYDDLRDNRIREGLRLEQEHIGFRWLNDCLEALLRGPGNGGPFTARGGSS